MGLGLDSWIKKGDPLGSPFKISIFQFLMLLDFPAYEDKHRKRIKKQQPLILLLG